MKKINLLLLFLLSLTASAQDLSVIPKESYKITNLGPQLADISLQGSVFAKSSTGNLLVYTVTRGTPAHLVGFDVKTQKLEADIALPGVDGSWDIEVSSTGIVYIAGGAGGILYKHTPGSNTAENLGKVLGTENYLWDLSAGKNGEIYGGTYPNCRIFKYHPDEGVSDFGNGAMAEEENYVRGMAYSPKHGKIFAGIGAHAHLVEMDVKTGVKRNILDSKYSDSKFVYDIGYVEGLKSGDRLYLNITGGNSKGTVVYNITKGVYEESLPAFSVKTVIKDPGSQKVYYVENGKLMMVDYDMAVPTPTQLSTFRGRPLAVTWNDKGELVYLNTYQQIVVFNPSTAEILSYGLKVPPQYIALTYLDMGPDKKLWSGGYLSGNNSAFDLNSNTAKVYKGLSQTESATKLGTKIYFGNYPGSRFNVYDTSLGWNKDAGNPKLIGSIQGQDRPFGALAVPSLQKVFFGTVPDYGKNGGVLIEIDAVTDKIVKHVQVVANQSVITLAYQNNMVVGGCSIWGGLGGEPVDQEAKLFVWDPISKQKVIDVVPVAGAKAITALFNGPDGLVWGYASGTLFKFDVNKKQVVLNKRIYLDNRNTFLWRPDSFVVHSSGIIYGAINGKLIALNPETLETQQFQTSGADLILGLENEMYYRSGKELYRLDILK